MFENPKSSCQYNWRFITFKICYILSRAWYKLFLGGNMLFYIGISLLFFAAAILIVMVFVNEKSFFIVMCVVAIIVFSTEMTLIVVSTNSPKYKYKEAIERVKKAERALEKAKLDLEKLYIDYPEFKEENSLE